MLDLRRGYHQLSLHPDSRGIATFSTPWGNLRPTRLIFGAKPSQDLFDEMMYKIFGDIPNCMNQRDDILIGGRNMKEHNETLIAVLQRAENFGIIFNKEKSVFGVDEIDFYGYRFTKEGLKPSHEEVKAEVHSQNQKKLSEVFSVWWVTYQNLSTNTRPLLRKLTEKDMKFKWGPTEQTAFE